VPDRTISPDELILLLERLRLPSAGERHAPDVALEQVEVLFARIASLTEALRGATEDDIARLGGRMLIGDLALVTAQSRGRTNELVGALTRARDNIRGEIDSTDQSSSHEEGDPPGAR
jgi:hypothetical protein